MDFIIFGSTVFIILFIIRVYNYYKPKIDFVYNEDKRSILLWYSIYDEYHWEKRTHKTLITF